MSDSYDVIGSGAGGGTLVRRLNPALTAMADAVRIGDHLLERVGAHSGQ